MDNLSTVAAPILSLGKLLREGWAFHFEGKDLYALTPGGAHKLQVKLGEDNILRLPHTIRTGKDSEPLPSPGKVSAVRHTIDKATSQLLHDIFNHASMEKIFQTLGVTKGYKQVRLPDFHCDACPQAKARRRGISHKVHMAQEKPTDSESDEVPALESDSDTEGTYSTDSNSESDNEAALTP